MNPGQEKFYNFILERVKDDRQEDAKALLAESFGKQADGTFGPEYMQDFNKKMLAILKPEHIEEVKGIMNEFRG